MQPPMTPANLSKLLDSLSRLSAEDLLSAKDVIAKRSRDVECSLVIKEAEKAMSSCPHCGHDKFSKFGTKDGRQRFRCKSPDCMKTFNALTGTPVARLRMAEKHIDHGTAIADRVSVRDSARRLGIAVTTAFRWRHRFLVAGRDSQPPLLSGLVEADETFFLESFKGQRQGLPRPAKVRGTPAKKPGLSAEQIPVLVARDRSSGATLTARVASRSAKDIGAVLRPVLSKDSLLVSDGARAYSVIAKEKGVESKRVKAKTKKSGIYHINNVNAYDSRLKGWMYDFHGVATKYLPNYLGWHRMMDNKQAYVSGQTLVAAMLRYKKRPVR